MEIYRWPGYQSGRAAIEPARNTGKDVLHVLHVLHVLCRLNAYSPARLYCCLSLFNCSDSGKSL